MEPQPSRTQRFNRYIRESPPVLIVGLLLLLLTTVGAVFAYGRDAYDWADRRWWWRDTEYAKLTELHSDLTLATFERVLGPPQIDRQASGKWVIRVFARPGMSAIPGPSRLSVRHSSRSNGVCDENSYR